MNLELLGKYESREKELLKQLEERESLPPRDIVMALPRDYLNSSLWSNIDEMNEDIHDRLNEDLNEKLDDEYNKASHLSPKKFRTFIHSVLKQISVFDSVVEQSYNSLTSKEQEEEIEDIFEILMDSKLRDRIRKVSEMDEFEELDDSDFYPKNQFEAFINEGKSQDKAIFRGDTDPSDINDIFSSGENSPNKGEVKHSDNKGGVKS